MGASETIYPAGGVLHQGEGPTRREERMSTVTLKATLAEVTAYVVQSWVRRDRRSIRRVTCRSRTLTRVVGGGD